MKNSFHVVLVSSLFFLFFEYKLYTNNNFLVYWMLGIIYNMLYMTQNLPVIASVVFIDDDLSFPCSVPKTFLIIELEMVPFRLLLLSTIASH